MSTNNPYSNQPNPDQPQQPYPQQPQQPYPPQAPYYPPQQPPAPAPKKKRTGCIISAVVVVVALFACIGVFSALPKSSTTTTTTTSTTDTSSAATAAPTKAAKPLAWTTVQSFKGNGIKTTPTFTVGDTWKIKYSCKGMGSGIDGLLAVTVYGSDGSMQSVAVNATCKDGQTTTDETIEHQGGSIYLNINATSEWTVDVQEQK